MNEGTVILAATVVAVAAAGAVVGGIVLEPAVDLGGSVSIASADDGPDAKTNGATGGVAAAEDGDGSGGLPPGVDRADGVDAERLAEAHAGALAAGEETTVRVVRRDAGGATIENRTIEDGTAVREAVERYLRAGAFTVERTSREDGRTVVYLTADEPAEDAADALGVGSVVRLTGTATVAADGRIEALKLRFTYRNADGDRIGTTATVETGNE